MTLQTRTDQAIGAGEYAPLLAAHLADWAAHWSLGTFGALAEFSRDAAEPADLQNDPVLSVVTPRGGIRLAPRGDMRLFASEGVTKTSWSQRLALCLPADRCAMSGRCALTELGPDVEALRPADRGAILFDLGLGVQQVDVCIRVADEHLAAKLRACAGKSLFAADNPAMGLILAASPPRVFIGPLGRIEVEGPIPPPGGRSPEGPHTHVLPKLLAHKRTHSATEPIPPGFVPCAHLYPPHPLRDGLGREQTFDVRRLDAFQAILRRFGDPAALALKQNVTVAVRRGDDPAAFPVPYDRFARATIRVALRQLAATDGVSPALARWIAHYDRVQSSATDEDEIH